MQKAENDCYRYSDYVVSLLPFAKDHMVEHGMASGKICLYPERHRKSGLGKAVPLSRWFTMTSSSSTMTTDIFSSATRARTALPTRLTAMWRRARSCAAKRSSCLPIGPGPERDRLIEKAHKLKLDDVVEFLDPVPARPDPGTARPAGRAVYRSAEPAAFPLRREPEQADGLHDGGQAGHLRHRRAERHGGGRGVRHFHPAGRQRAPLRTRRSSFRRCLRRISKKWARTGKCIFLPTMSMMCCPISS